MSIELDLRLTSTDIVGLVRDLREQARREGGDLTVETVPFAGRVRVAYGYPIISPDDVAEATAAAAAGAGRIVHLAHPDAPAPRIFLADGPYAERALAALEATGSPVFDHRTVFTRIAVPIGPRATLRLSLDAATAATGRTGTTGPDGVTHLADADVLVLDPSAGVDAQAFARAVALMRTNAVTRNARVACRDDADFTDHGDIARLIAASVIEAGIRTTLRAAVTRGDAGSIRRLREHLDRHAALSGGMPLASAH